MEESASVSAAVGSVVHDCRNLDGKLSESDVSKKLYTHDVMIRMGPDGSCV